MFFFLWIPLGLISTFLIPAFFTIYALFSPLYASYKIQKTEKTCGHCKVTFPLTAEYFYTKTTKKGTVHR